MRLLVKEVDEDGIVAFEAKVTPGELNFLINFAVESLIQMGAINVAINDLQNEQEVELPQTIEDEPAENLPENITIN